MPSRVENVKLEMYIAENYPQKIQEHFFLLTLKYNSCQGYKIFYPMYKRTLFEKKFCETIFVAKVV